ncbi:hypothetical protein GE061_008907 [Apolygus lucorum]|uniref:Uncharacterized protein n=1 Tax=Apolygus lucorum TaxID=248454 RepID=A0A8S9Y0W2_APOLU|nr:hypothetical protein GE061_008907 [Apolygus lucorum]
MKLLSLIESLKVITFVDSMVAESTKVTEKNASAKTTTERPLSKVDYSTVFGFIVPHVMLCFEYVGFQRPEDVLTFFDRFPDLISTRQEKCFLRCVLRRTKVFKDPLGYKWSWIHAIKFLHSFGFTAGNQEADIKSAVFFCMRKKPRITSKYGCKNAYNFFICLRNHGIAFSWLSSEFIAQRLDYKRRFPLAQPIVEDMDSIKWNFGDMDKNIMDKEFGGIVDFNPEHEKFDVGNNVSSLINDSFLYDNNADSAGDGRKAPIKSQKGQIEKPGTQNKGSQPTLVDPNQPPLMDFKNFPTGDYYKDYQLRDLEFEVTKKKKTKKKKTDKNKKKRMKPRRTHKRRWTVDSVTAPLKRMSRNNPYLGLSL